MFGGGPQQGPPICGGMPRFAEVQREDDEEENETSSDDEEQPEERDVVDSASGGEDDVEHELVRATYIRGSAIGSRLRLGRWATTTTSLLLFACRLTKINNVFVLIRKLMLTRAGRWHPRNLLCVSNQDGGVRTN